MRVDFDALFRSMDHLIGLENADDKAVGAPLTGLLSSLVDFDFVVIFAYRGEQRPIDLYSTFDPQQYHVYVSLYQDGPYLLDPFYSTASSAHQGVWRMRDLAPDRFFASEYYRNYYIQTGLAEEVGFFIPMDEGVTVVVSLMRTEVRGAFRPPELAMLRKTEAVVAGIIRKFWGNLSPRFDAALTKAAKTGQAGAVAERAWANRNLTHREKSIIELVLQGHSSESIGLRLGVATGTIKVHRRNIYRKLGISSQAQLMSLYLGSLK
ncbi:MAG: hypothetical protein RLZZ444_3890 [Pseudomonadota bacterium]|jgi:DNA-binding NarL/FixJ family response regulator